jgi:hypothetical protein
MPQLGQRTFLKDAMSVFLDSSTRSRSWAFLESEYENAPDGRMAENKNIMAMERLIKENLLGI